MPGSRSTSRTSTANRFASDYSSIDDREVGSTCTLAVMPVPESDSRVEGTVTCRHLVADILSSDYDFSRTELQPSIDLSAQFACNL